MDGKLPRFLIAGRLTRNYIIFPSGEALIDAPGGNALYAAVGLAIWEPDPPPAIIARVGEDYPQEWLDQLMQAGINTRGVRILPEAVDVRSFCAFQEGGIRAYDDPIAHFARWGLPFPKALLGYRPSTNLVDSRTQMQVISLRQGDIPAEFLDVNAVHICPLDYLTHSLLPAALRQAQIGMITLDPSPGYMNSTYWGDIPALLTGLTAFMPAEEEIRSLFQGKSSDLWEMAACLAAYGCDIIVIKRGERGQLVYDGNSGNRWETPPYPNKAISPLGAGDAFCGGFLAGYRQTYDPLEATLHGSISASLVVEGYRPTYALDALPGLAQARLESLRRSVRKV